jgi:hypothetical protein
MAASLHGDLAAIMETAESARAKAQRSTHGKPPMSWVANFIVARAHNTLHLLTSAAARPAWSLRSASGHAGREMQ